MKTTVRMIATAAFATALPALFAGEKLPVDIGAGVDIMSHYVWRGQLLTDDPVVQPYAEIGIKGLTLNVWGSLDVTDINEAGDEDFRIQEVDYTLSYGFTPVDGLDLAAGVIYYDFPGTGFASTQEVFLSASLSNLPLAPGATVYYDFDEVEGIYANVGVSHTFALTEELGLSLGAGLGWGDEDYNAAYFGVNESALNDLGLTASLDYAVNENFSISVYAKYSEMLDSDIEDALADSDVFYGGVGFYFTY